MENLEITAKTVEEATRKALNQLNAKPEDVEITVLNEGRTGILGIGSEDARISVRLKQPEVSPEESAAQLAREVLENILNKMDFQADLFLEKNPQLSDDPMETNSITINVTGDDLGMLIGRRGQTLEALQYLVRVITSKKTDLRSPVIIDIENYKQRRYEDLKTLALNVAQQVKNSRSSIKLEPMSPYERRIVHMALANDPDINTESTGEGENRKVVVSPKQKR